MTGLFARTPLSFYQSFVIVLVGHGLLEISGIVVNVDIGELSGIMYGTIEILDPEGNRLQLRYGKDSEGEIPTTGSRVTVTYVGEAIPKIESIEILDYAKPDHDRAYINPLPEEPPVQKGKVQITWPGACIGCGDIQETNLKFYSHTWDSGRTVRGYLDKLEVMLSKTSNRYSSPTILPRAETKFDMNIYLCDDCRKRSHDEIKRPFMICAIVFGVLLSTIIYVSFSTSYLFGEDGFVNQGFLELFGTLGLFFVLLTVPFTLLHANYRAFEKPYLKYMKLERVEYSYHSAIPRITLINYAYHDVMKTINPKLIVELDQGSSGTKDYGDGFVIGFIIFNIIMPFFLSFLVR
ncbi:MAG: hypothetical protein ACFFF4_01285 [Candidatus Thorarchaeota archaeon]